MTDGSIYAAWHTYPIEEPEVLLTSFQRRQRLESMYLSTLIAPASEDYPLYMQLETLVRNKSVNGLEYEYLSTLLHQFDRYCMRLLKCISYKPWYEVADDYTSVYGSAPPKGMSRIVMAARQMSHNELMAYVQDARVATLSTRHTTSNHILLGMELDTFVKASAALPSNVNSVTDIQFGFGGSCNGPSDPNFWMHDFFENETAPDPYGERRPHEHSIQSLNPTKRSGVYLPPMSLRNHVGNPQGTQPLMACCGQRIYIDPENGKRRNPPPCWLSLVPNQDKGVILPYEICRTDRWQQLAENSAEALRTLEDDLRQQDFQVGTAFRDAQKYYALHNRILEKYEMAVPEIAKAYNRWIQELDEAVEEERMQDVARYRLKLRDGDERNFVVETLRLVGKYNEAHCLVDQQEALRDGGEALDQWMEQHLFHRSSMLEHWTENNRGGLKNERGELLTLFPMPTALNWNSLPSIGSYSDNLDKFVQNLAGFNFPTNLPDATKAKIRTIVRSVRVQLDNYRGDAFQKQVSLADYIGKWIDNDATVAQFRTDVARFEEDSFNVLTQTRSLLRSARNVPLEQNNPELLQTQQKAEALSIPTRYNFETDKRLKEAQVKDLQQKIATNRLNYSTVEFVTLEQADIVKDRMPDGWHKLVNTVYSNLKNPAIVNFDQKGGFFKTALEQTRNAYEKMAMDEQLDMNNPKIAAAWKSFEQDLTNVHKKNVDQVRKDLQETLAELSVFPTFNQTYVGSDDVRTKAFEDVKRDFEEKETKQKLLAVQTIANTALKGKLQQVVNNERQRLDNLAEEDRARELARQRQEAEERARREQEERRRREQEARRKNEEELEKQQEEQRRRQRRQEQDEQRAQNELFESIRARISSNQDELSALFRGRWRQDSSLDTMDKRTEFAKAYDKPPENSVVGQLKRFIDVRKRDESSMFSAKYIGFKNRINSNEGLQWIFRPKFGEPNQFDFPSRIDFSETLFESGFYIGLYVGSKNDPNTGTTLEKLQAWFRALGDWLVVLEFFGTVNEDHPLVRFNEKEKELDRMTDQLRDHVKTISGLFPQPNRIDIVPGEDVNVYNLVMATKQQFKIEDAKNSGDLLSSSMQAWELNSCWVDASYAVLFSTPETTLTNALYATRTLNTISLELRLQDNRVITTLASDMLGCDQTAVRNLHFDILRDIRDNQDPDASKKKITCRSINAWTKLVQCVTRMPMPDENRRDNPKNFIASMIELYNLENRDLMKMIDAPLDLVWDDLPNQDGDDFVPNQTNFMDDIAISVSGVTRHIVYSLPFVKDQTDLKPGEILTDSENYELILRTALENSDQFRNRVDDELETRLRFQFPLQTDSHLLTGVICRQPNHFVAYVLDMYTKDWVFFDTYRQQQPENIGKQLPESIYKSIKEYTRAAYLVYTEKEEVQRLVDMKNQALGIVPPTTTGDDDGGGEQDSDDVELFDQDDGDGSGGGGGIIEESSEEGEEAQGGGANANDPSETPLAIPTAIRDNDSVFPTAPLELESYVERADAMANDASLSEAEREKYANRARFGRLALRSLTIEPSSPPQQDTPSLLPEESMEEEEEEEQADSGTATTSTSTTVVDPVESLAVAPMMYENAQDRNVALDDIIETLQREKDANGNVPERNRNMQRAARLMKRSAT